MTIHKYVVCGRFNSSTSLPYQEILRDCLRMRMISALYAPIREGQYWYFDCRIAGFLPLGHRFATPPATKIMKDRGLSTSDTFLTSYSLVEVNEINNMPSTW